MINLYLVKKKNTLTYKIRSANKETPTDAHGFRVKMLLINVILHLLVKKCEDLSKRNINEAIVCRDNQE